MGGIIEMDYQIDLNMYVYCIRTGWPSIVIVKFGQMNILDSVRWGDNLLTCVRQCMQYKKIDKRSNCCVSQKLLKQ